MKNIGEVCVYEVRKAYRKGRKKGKERFFWSICVSPRLRQREAAVL